MQSAVQLLEAAKTRLLQNSSDEMYDGYLHREEDFRRNLRTTPGDCCFVGACVYAATEGSEYIPGVATTFNSTSYVDAREALRAVAPNGDLYGYNDSHKRPEVLALIDEAIANLQC